MTRRRVETTHHKADSGHYKGYQNVVSRRQRRAELQPLFDLDPADLRDVELSHDQLDALIHAWNNTDRSVRVTERALCTHGGHERVGIEGTSTRICRRCCESVRGTP